MLNKTRSLAVLFLCAGAGPALAVMDGQGHDFFPVAAIFTASATITYTNAVNAGLTVSSGLVVNNGTVALAVSSGGNVGIGTAAPDAKLAIKQDGSGAGNYQLFLEQSNANHGYVMRSDAANGHLTFSRKTDATYTETVRFEAGGNVGIGTTGPGSKFEVVGGSSTFRGSDSNSAIAGFTDAGGNYRMVVSTSGNVGIGTTSPAVKLDIESGDIRINDGGALWLKDGSVDPERHFYLLNAGDSLWFREGNSGNPEMVLTNGNVGIGTTIPTSKLQIQGTTTDNTASALNAANSAGSSVLYARNDGKVGIWTTNPGETLEVNGNIKITNGASYKSDRIVAPTSAAYFILNSDAVTGVRLDNGASSWAAQSDIRLKDIIEPINNSIQKVLAINPVIYRFKTDAPTVRRSGIIAQDVQRVLPEVVSVGDDDYLSVRYTELIPLLIGAIKEQQARIDDLSARLAKVEAGGVK